ETGAENALDDEGFVEPDLTAGEMEGSPCADAGAGRRTVDLAVGEHADVAAVMLRLFRRPDEDDAVEKAQIRLRRVFDGQRRHDGALDAHADVDELTKARRVQANAETAGVDKGVECAAKGHIVAHAAEAGHVDALVERIDE